MSRNRKPNVTTDWTNELQARAGWFLDSQHPGPSKDKRVANLLGISPDMAGLLRRGRGWTVARIEQCRRIYGRAFDQVVFGLPVSPADMMAELAELRSEISQTRVEIAHVAARLAALPVAPMAREADQREGGAAEHRSGKASAEGGAAGWVVAQRAADANAAIRKNPREEVDTSKTPTVAAPLKTGPR